MSRKKKLQPESFQITYGEMTIPSDATFELFGETWKGISDVLSMASSSTSFSPDSLSGANYSKLKYLRKVYEADKDRRKRAKKSGKKCTVTDNAHRVPCFDISDFLYDWRMIHSITIRGKNGETATIEYTDGNGQITIRIK